MSLPETLQEVKVQLLPSRHWWQAKELEGTIRCPCGGKTTVQGPLKFIQSCPPIFCRTCGRLLVAVCVVEDAALHLMTELRTSAERN